MNINFFDDPHDRPVMREDVRLIDIQIEVAPDGRRVALDLELTPFIERPSIDLLLENERGERAGALTIIETMNHRVGVVVHLRDKSPTAVYNLSATVYYASLDKGKRQVVHQMQTSFQIEA